MEDIKSFYAQIMEKYPFVTYVDTSNSDNLNFYLGDAIKTYWTFSCGIEKKENSFKVYPVTVNEQFARYLYEREMRKLAVQAFSSKLPIETLIASRTKEYQEKIKEIMDYAQETPMEPYYGEPTFMFERASYVLECIKKLPTEVPNIDKIYQKLQDFMQQYGPQKDDLGRDSYPYYTEEFKTAYYEFEKAYYAIILIEKNLFKEVEQIWKSTLTDPNHHNDQSFKYLIHVFSSGQIPLESMGKVCCSYATEKLLTTPYGNTGIICDMDSESLETMCTEDAGSWTINKREFVSRKFPTSWQLPNPEGDGVFFEYPKISKLILPSDLEREAIAHNIAVNGEMLNYSKFIGYSEIFLNKKAKAIGVFYTDECKDITEIQAYAEKYHLPLIHLSLQKLRENVGMDPVARKGETESSYHY